MIALALAAVYVIGFIFVLGFGIADQMSFVNPAWGLVAGVSVGWPIVALYAIGNRVFA